MAWFWKRADTQMGGNVAAGAQQTAASAPQNTQMANRPGTGVIGMGNAPGGGNAGIAGRMQGPRPTVGSASPFNTMFNPLVAQARAGWSGLTPGSAAPSTAAILNKKAMMSPGVGGMPPVAGETANMAPPPGPPGMGGQQMPPNGGQLPPPPPNGGAPVPGDPNAQGGQPQQPQPQGPTPPMMDMPPQPLPANPRPPQPGQQPGQMPMQPQQPMSPQLADRTNLMQGMLDDKEQVELDPSQAESYDDLKSQSMAMKVGNLKSTFEKLGINKADDFMPEVHPEADPQGLAVAHAQQRVAGRLAAVVAAPVAVAIHPGERNAGLAVNAEPSWCFGWRGFGRGRWLAVQSVRPGDTDSLACFWSAWCLTWRIGCLQSSSQPERRHH